MDTKMAATTLPLASTVKQFLKSPFGSSGKYTGKASYFGSAKNSAYSALDEDYFLNVEKGAAPSTRKSPLKARATMEASVSGEKVRFFAGGSWVILWRCSGCIQGKDLCEGETSL